MKRRKLLRIITLILGLATMLFFVYVLIVFSRVRGKIESFLPLTGGEETMILWVGFGLIMVLIFYLLSLYLVVRKIRHSEKMPFLLTALVIFGVIAVLFVFADIALLSDIINQYEAGLDQPEWSLLYPILSGQFVIVVVFTLLHGARFFIRNELKEIRRDGNVFQIVQFVGVICGGMGLTAGILGFFYPNSWNQLVHTTISTLILLFPYFLTVLYWFLVKFKEGDRQFFDEKQQLDIGSSAFWTLIVSSVVMTGLYVGNYYTLEGVIRLTWLPFHLFTVMFLFSLGNIYFSRRV
jgi:hypothetical protein